MQKNAIFVGVSEKCCTFASSKVENAMRKKTFLMALSSMMMTLSACQKDDEEVKTPEMKTVLIYMSAENSLSYDSEGDLAEIKEGSLALTEEDQLLVYYDRAKIGELPWLGRIVNGQLTDSVSIADMQISDKDEYASDPHVFEKVLTYAFSHYPATAGYGLTFWGHASGWLKSDSIAYSRGYGIDNGSNNPNSDTGFWLNIPTIRKVLETQPHLEFILADCCNFMCLESLYELREVTDYVVGSPAEIPDRGAPYHTVVPEMFKRQNAVKGIIQKYADEYPNYLPLSVVNMSEIDALAEATRTVVKAIYSRLETDYPDMAETIHYFNTYDSKFYPWYNIYYDAGDFIKKFATSEEYSQWKAVADRAVVEKVFSKSWTVGGIRRTWTSHYSDFEATEEKYHGVSMFVPQDPEKGYYGRYNEDIKLFAWWWEVFEN